VPLGVEEGDDRPSRVLELELCAVQFVYEVHVAGVSRRSALAERGQVLVPDRDAVESRK